MSRAPSLNGPPPSFANHRDLPSLPPLSRAPSVTAMSIHSVLGGPSSASTTSSHYPSPGTAAPPNTAFSSTHASPRVGSDYGPFRRPHTPDYPRTFDSRDRANSAGSPSSATAARFSTPEGRRYGTPHSYASRPPPGQGGLFDDRRDLQGRGPTSMPPRPSSQPNGYNLPPSRAPERASHHNDPMYGRRSEGPSRNGSDAIFGRRPDEGRREAPHRSEMSEEQRYYEQERNARLYEERDLREREAAYYTMMREREQREREQERVIADRRASFQGDYGHQMPPQAAFGRGAEVREPESWRGPNHDVRPPYDQHPERPPQSAAGYGPPSHYPPQPAPVAEPRYGPSGVPQHGSIQVSPYEASIIERQRQAQQERLQQQAQQQAFGPTSHPQLQSRESPPRRLTEEAPPMQQSRSLLGPGEMNRKGRASPLPQAVQGAQLQQAGPAGEPHIKNEFGRMFSGIGSGVGGMGVPSPVSANAPGVPFSNPSQSRRENLDGLGQQDSPTDLGSKIPREASRGGRRKKMMDDDKEDEGGTGRITPGSRGKKPKLHHHHSHHHQ